MANTERFAALVLSFPVMQYAPPRAVRPDGVDLMAIDEWAMTADPDGSEGILSTVQFLLSVWSASHPWRVGRFDLFRALDVWDDGQRYAFTAWIGKPWRP